MWEEGTGIRERSSATGGKANEEFLGTDGHGFEKGTASCAMDKGFICLKAILKV